MEVDYPESTDIDASLVDDLDYPPRVALEFYPEEGVDSNNKIQTCNLSLSGLDKYTCFPFTLALPTQPLVPKGYFRQLSRL